MFSSTAKPDVIGCWLATEVPMRSCRFTPCIAALGAALLVAASGSAAGVDWRPVGDTPGFPGLQARLQRIAGRLGRGRAATFCVVLRDSGDRDPLAYALWPDRHLLYRWQATTDAMIGDATLLHHAPLDLATDIVRTDADRLSTYKVTRSWVRNVDAQCNAHGEQVRIVRQWG